MVSAEKSASVHLHTDPDLQTSPGRPPSPANGPLGAAAVEPRGAALFQCLGAAIRGPLQGAEVLLLHNECILADRNKASVFHRRASAMESAAPRGR